MLFSHSFQDQLCSNGAKRMQTQGESPNEPSRSAILPLMSSCGMSGIRWGMNRDLR